MNIRTVGVGLAAGGYFMAHGFAVTSYMQKQLQESPLVAFHTALNSIAPAAANALAENFVIPLSWASLCLGGGLFVAGIVWPMVEWLLSYAWGSVWRLLTNIHARVTHFTEHQDES